MSDPEPITPPTSSQNVKKNSGPGCIGAVTRILLLAVIGLALLLPFTPVAGRIKRGIQEIVRAARDGDTKVITKEILREIEVPTEVVKEVVREVEVIKEVPAPPPPLPEDYIPRKDVDVATLFNGITINSTLVTEQGTYANLERLDPKAYQAEFQLTIRVPKANQSVSELARINKHLPAMLPDLKAMVETSKVSGFYHKLYENKTNAVKRDITRLNKALDRHNFFDCETILELTHPTSKRRALMIQSEMDVVADGSDGDRMATLDDYIWMSDYYQPFTSYGWAKRTKTPNPLLARWEERLKKAKEEYAIKGLSAERNAYLRSTIHQVDLEIKDMKARSSLIAEKDPFIVISLLFRGYSDSNKHTPHIGDYAAVLYEDKIYPAICGDYGPTLKMGEASLFVAKTVNEKATPYRRPESDLKVTYVIFPGTAEKPYGPPNLEKWYAKVGEYLTDLGGIGSGYALHQWEDPFKKEEPEPAPESGPTTEVSATAETAETGTTPETPATTTDTESPTTTTPDAPTEVKSAVVPTTPENP